jgi:hypothetical protein
MFIALEHFKKNHHDDKIEYICDNVLNLSKHKLKADIVIVCWTWPSRDNEVDSDRHIESLQEHLEYYNIPYIFTCADNCIITGN